MYRLLHRTKRCKGNAGKRDVWQAKDIASTQTRIRSRPGFLSYSHDTVRHLLPKPCVKTAWPGRTHISHTFICSLAGVRKGWEDKCVAKTKLILNVDFEKEEACKNEACSLNWNHLSPVQLKTSSTLHLLQKWPVKAERWRSYVERKTAQSEGLEQEHHWWSRNWNALL